MTAITFAAQGHGSVVQVNHPPLSTSAVLMHSLRVYAVQPFSTTTEEIAPPRGALWP